MKKNKTKQCRNYSKSCLASNGSEKLFFKKNYSKREILKTKIPNEQNITSKEFNSGALSETRSHICSNNRVIPLELNWSSKLEKISMYCPEQYSQFKINMLKANYFFRTGHTEDAKNSVETALSNLLIIYLLC